MAKGAKPLRNYHRNQQKKSKVEDEEIKTLNKIIDEEAPPRGSNPLAISKPENPTFATARKFEDLPLSRYTKDALKIAKFTQLTAIQRAALPHALCGRDVLGAAKTGSGKTLAFIIPLLESLYRSKWGTLDGLGALIISPTRELALQIFEELKKAGKKHEFSAGLLIGGKDVEEEAVRVSGLNILVATPGRLLQHMDETPGFDASNLQVLILDEADRILDMGFSATINAIISNLPIDRQTLLFSATQTKTVSALARLSLKSPEYVSVHADAETPTPVRLDQTYMECQAGDKLDIIWSFIKTHLSSRIIIFLSTCKQVRFVHETFRRLRPGTPLRLLHGHMSQYKRLAVYQQFCDGKAGVLFATDIAARGLDFPSIDWVVQADCPENTGAYIHRVGRTARYTSSGKGLLLLYPSEVSGMVTAFEEAKIPIRSIRHNPAKVQPVTPALQALLSKDSELKEIAQRALTAYLRSIFLHPNKKVFDVTKLDVEALAMSMGLLTVPKLRFLKASKKAVGGTIVGKKVPATKKGGDEESEDEEEESKSDSGDEESDQSLNLDDDDDDLLVIKRRNVLNDDNDKDIEQHGIDMTLPTSLNKKKKPQKINPGKPTGTRIVFDEEGQAMAPLELLARHGKFTSNINDDRDDGNGNILDGGLHRSIKDRSAAAQAVMAHRDKEDKARLRDLRKAQRIEKRSKRLAREGGGGVPVDGGVALYDDDENIGYSESDGDESDGDESDGDESDGDDVYEKDSDDIDLIMDSDGEETHNGMKSAQKKKSKAQEEVSHMGMMPVKKHKKNVDTMSLADQEALALHLLRQK